MGKDDGERFAPWDKACVINSILTRCGKISPNDRYGDKDSSSNDGIVWICTVEENIFKSKDGKRVVEIKKDEISI